MTYVPGHGDILTLVFGSKVTAGGHITIDSTQQLVEFHLVFVIKLMCLFYYYIIPHIVSSAVGICCKQSLNIVNLNSRFHVLTDY